MILDVALLFLRLCFAGLLLFGHGLNKLLQFSDMALIFPDPLHLGPMVSLSLSCFAEVFCSALVMIGFATRLAVIPICITMLVAVILVHSGDPWNKKELAIVYLIPFITLFMTGPGRLSVDSLLGWAKSFGR